MSVELATTTVIDAGARYGMHPSWQKFDGALRYFAFEPDGREAERLRRCPQRPGFEIVECALASGEGERELRIARHRGCSSFLEVDQGSEWFSRYRQGEGDVKSVVRVKTCSIDGFADARGLRVDFLKVDTEGTELEVLEGANRQLASHVMGVRVNVNFQPGYKDQPLFQDIHTFLTARNFVLLNLDYFGRGLPCYPLFGNPDPLTLDTERYGVLFATDGVWVKRDALIRSLAEREDERGYVFAILKYTYFCILNHAPDVGLDVLMRFVGERPGALGDDVAGSELYVALRRACARFLGRWRVYPDARWDLARRTFRMIFGMELPGGAEYWELIQSL